MRPHDPPLFSSIEPSIRTIIPRIFSAPSMLAAQANYQTGADTSSARKRPHEVTSSSEDAAPAETENDSGNSAATAEDAACPAIDTSPFTAFSKLSGCVSSARALATAQTSLALVNSGLYIRYHKPLNKTSAEVASFL